MNARKDYYELTDDVLNIFRARMLYKMIDSYRKYAYSYSVLPDDEIYFRMLQETCRDYRNEKVIVGRDVIYYANFTPTNKSFACDITTCRNFLDACLHTSGKEMEQYLGSRPLSKVLWSALHSVEMDKDYERLDRLFIAYMQYSIQDYHGDYHNIDSKFETSHSNFYMLVDYMGKMLSPNVLFKKITEHINTLSNYSPKLFLTMLGDADKVLKSLNLVRYKNYYDVEKINSSDLRKLNMNIDDLRATIIHTVSSKTYIGHIFKKPEDIAKILYFLDSDEWTQSKHSSNSSFSNSINTLSASMTSYIISNKALMREIYNSPYRAALYKYLPKIEKPCSDAVTYRNAALGLLTAKKSGEKQYISQLPNDVIQMNASMVEDAVKEDGQDNAIEPNKNKPG